jgi:hypothetical protein
MARLGQQSMARLGQQIFSLVGDVPPATGRGAAAAGRSAAGPPRASRLRPKRSSGGSGWERGGGGAEQRRGKASCRGRPVRGRATRAALAAPRLSPAQRRPRPARPARRKALHVAKRQHRPRRPLARCPATAQGFWELRPEQRRLLPRARCAAEAAPCLAAPVPGFCPSRTSPPCDPNLLGPLLLALLLLLPPRANLRVAAFLVGLTALAALNALVVRPRRSSAQHGAARRRAVQHGAERCSTAQSGAAWCSTSEGPQHEALLMACSRPSSRAARPQPTLNPLPAPTARRSPSRWRPARWATPQRRMWSYWDGAAATGWRSRQPPTPPPPRQDLPRRTRWLRV